jgi:hypothetical protein
MAHKTSYRTRRIIFAGILIAAVAACIVLNPNSYQYARQIDGSVQKPEEIQPKDETTPDSMLAVDVLESLAVRAKDKTHQYYRKLFYDSWGLTASGCNTREAILARDLEGTVFNGCKVQSGILNDPYTGSTISFVRGQDTSGAVQIDHVVALSNAWATGAFNFDAGLRYEISQDPLNLLAVDGPANQDKLDQDASDWLPPNQNFHCQYVARQISVKAKYHLWVTPAEKSAMQGVLATCPNEPTVGLENQ